MWFVGRKYCTAAADNCTIVCNTHRGEAATTRHDRCNVSGRRGASHYLSSSSFARDLSDFARLSLTALFVGNWSRIYQPALIYRVLLLMSS